MPPSTCPSCRSTKLYQPAKSGWVIGGDGMFDTAPTRCVVCTSCGHIVPYVEGAGLDKVRRWASK